MAFDAPMKVAMLAASVSREAGGLFWAIRAMSASLLDIRCRVHVFGGEDRQTEADRLSWGRVPVSVQRVAGPRAFGFQRQLLQKLSRYQPELLHTHGLWMYPSMAALRWSRGERPYVISPHGMLDPWAVKNSSSKKKFVELLYEGAHLRGAACLHALCEAEFQAIRAFGLKNPVAVIPNGIDLPDLAAPVLLPDWEAKLPPGSKVLLFLSRLHPKKGLANLVEAWSQARQRADSVSANWHLVIAGWEQGGHQDELQRQARALGVDSSVHFVGPQFDQAKAACFSRADAFVLPSFSEGLPMVVLEAWSYARPVLMTPQCNLPEGLAAGAAIRIEPAVDSVLNGLSALFSMDAADRRAMGARGRELVEQRFTWGQVGTEMAAVYRWVLGQGDKPDCVRIG